MISGSLAKPVATPGGIKINIATPAYKSEYSSAYVRSLYMLLTSAPGMGLRFSFSEIDYSDIVVSRNYLASNFFYNKLDCSHLLFLDADMGFPHQLIAEMVGLKEDVVGVVYPKRSFNAERIHASANLPFEKAYAKACDFIGQPEQPHPHNSCFHLVQGCGTGILLISRNCLGKMLACCPEINDPIRYKQMPFSGKFTAFITPFSKVILSDRELSEDFSFCHRWTQACGGSIYANVTHSIEHVASTTIKTCYTDAL